MEQDRCCVPCCFEDRLPLHPFPDNFKLFEEWRKSVKNPSISYSSRHLRTSKVCDAHFSEADRNPEDPTQLLEYSIPTLYVPDFYGDMAAIKQFSSISESRSSACALCSCLNNHLIPIFGKEGEKNDLATKIHKYLPTTVVDEDLICFSCTTTLMAFHNLFKNCRNVTEVISQDQDTLPRDNGRVCAETQEGNNVSEPSPAKTKKSTTNKEKSYVEKDLEENDENLETNKATNQVGKSSRPSCRTINKCPYNWKELKTILINNSLRFYTCHLCGVCLPNVKNLQEHYKDCSQNICSRCLKVVGRGVILEEHMKICREYACYFCPDKNMVKNTVNKHLTKIHPVRACELCHHHTFLNDMEYELHRLDTHKFLCERCNNYFESRIEDEQYRRTILPLERLLCLTCYGEYHQIPKIREVGIPLKLVNIDTDEANEDVTKFFCITCRSTFDTEVDLTSHDCISKNDLGLKIDHQYVKVEDILSCPHCAKIFASHLLLRAHISRNHPGEPDFTCLVCTIIFHSESELQNHQRIHSASESETISLRSYGCLPLQSYGDESFTCKYCSKECKSISRLGKHVYAHHRPKKWLCCTICGVLVEQHKMYLHFIRKHPKSYNCRLCPEVFETHAEYTLHRKVGHPRIVCSNCLTRFKRQTELNRHLKKCQAPSNELCQLEIEEQTFIE